MPAKTTTKKKKPKCTKGTACGYSCIAAGKVCNQPVPKEAAEENLAAVPAKGKKADKKKAKAEPKADEQKKPKGKFLYIKTEDGGKIPVTGDGPVDREEDAYMDEKELKRVKKELAKKGVETEIGEAEEKPKEAAKKDVDGEEKAKEVYQTIKDLETELSTDNYLPIYHVREKFKDMSDEEFEKTIYKLWGEDKIDMSDLMDTTGYTKKQVEAGLKDDFGRNFFFIVDNNPNTDAEGKPKGKKGGEEEIKGATKKTWSERSEKEKKQIINDVASSIVDLDEEHQTDNYLPIFYIRDKMKKQGLTREDVDQALYALSKEDKIDFSKLVDPTLYTREQVEAGIPTDIGGSLFFIVNNGIKKNKKKANK